MTARIRSPEKSTSGMPPGASMPTAALSAAPLMTVRDIGKAFGDQQVLAEVSFEVASVAARFGSSRNR